MIRRYSLFLVMICVLAAGMYAGYRLIWDKTNTQTLPLSFVPADAAVIVTGNDLTQLRDRLENTSLFWQDVRNSGSEFLSPWFFKIGCTLRAKNPEAAFSWSMHAEGKGKPACLLVVATGNKLGESEKNAWKKLGMIFTAIGGEDDRFTLQKDNWTYYGAATADVFILATHETLLQTALSQHESGNAVTAEPGFTRISATAEDDVPLHIYFRHRSVLALLSPFLSTSAGGISSGISEAEKSFWDVKIEPDAFAFNGFVFSGNEMNAATDVMNGQQPVEPRLLKWLPENTTEFLYFGFSSKDKFLDNAQAIRGRQETKKELSAFNQQYNCNLERHLLSWLDNEMILFNTGDTSRVLIMKIDETARPQEELNFLSGQLDSTGAQNMVLHDFVVRRLDAEDIFVPLLGQAFSGIDRPYYLQLENVMVFATTPGAIESYINQMANDRRLIRNAVVYDDLHHYFSSGCNLLYHKIITEKGGWSTWINTGVFPLTTLFPVSANISSVTLQLSNSGKGLYYANALIKYRKSGQSTTLPTIFDVQLDTLAYTHPFVVRNHITGSHSIIVQDRAHRLYAFSSTGKPEWKLNLKEPVVGDVQYIDIFQNGKFQVLVATKTKLHIIDLKGNYVKGFPVELGAEVSATPAVMDYEGNGNFRFMVACGSAILNIDKDGKRVKGFEYAGTPGKIIQQPLFIRADNKDYLFVCDSEGNVQLLDRKGKIRHAVPFNLHDRSEWPVLLEPGRTLETTKLVYANKNGTLVRRYIGGGHDSLPGYRVDLRAGIGYMDMDADGFSDFIFTDSSKICVAGTDYKVRTSLTPPCNRFVLFAFKPLHSEPVIAGWCREGEELFAFDPRGAALIRTRLRSDKPLLVSDLNNDHKPEILYTYGNRVFVYSLR